MSEMTKLFGKGDEFVLYSKEGNLIYYIIGEFAICSGELSGSHIPCIELICKDGTEECLYTPTWMFQELFDERLIYPAKHASTYSKIRQYKSLSREEVQSKPWKMELFF